MLYEFIFEPAPRLRQHRRKVGFGSIASILRRLLRPLSTIPDIHVRLGLACLSACRARIANDRRSRGSSGVLPSTS
jgi:hypothetical protein